MDCKGRMFSMNKFYHVIYSILWVLAKVFYPWKAKGAENLPKSGGVVLCGNHTSFIDPILVLLSAGKNRQLHIVAKAELFNIPVLNWILKNIEVISVKRGKSDIAAFKECLRVLKNQGSLLIFPEGTRVKGGEEIDGRPGAVVMAARSGVPIVPIYIEPKKRMFRKSDVIFGEPYMLEFAGRKPTPEESHQLTEDLMIRIRALGENT